MTLREQLTQHGINVNLALTERYDNSQIYQVLPFLQMNRRLSQVLIFKWLELLSKQVARLSNSNSEYPDDDYLAEILCRIVCDYGDLEIGG